jgi:hypothetical protein
MYKRIRLDNWSLPRRHAWGDSKVYRRTGEWPGITIHVGNRIYMSPGTDDRNRPCRCMPVAVPAKARAGAAMT